MTSDLRDIQAHQGFPNLLPGPVLQAPGQTTGSREQEEGKRVASSHRLGALEGQASASG